jgi:adenylylsulfate kinase-like enzyme
MEGTVFWITGMSGAGKTSVAEHLHWLLRENYKNTVILDGDTLREVFSNDLGYTREERIIGATRNSRICKMLANQGIHVVCATISMFDICRDWNRQNIQNYKEIYLRASMETLLKRDKIQLYSRGLSNDVNNVIGIDIELEEPKSPDLIIDNNGCMTPLDIATIIYKKYPYSKLV